MCLFRGYIIEASQLPPWFLGLLVSEGLSSYVVRTCKQLHREAHVERTEPSERSTLEGNPQAQPSHGTAAAHVTLGCNLVRDPEPELPS